MAKNRNSQSASIRFGPALAALFACFVIAGAAVGYVWQKGQIYQLGKQIRANEIRLAQLQKDDDQRVKDLAELRSPMKLDARAKELNLGLVPAQPMQVVRLAEPSISMPENKNPARQFAARPIDATTQ
jgi:cell division protein FtsL